jgi:ABC-type phosphate transport system auxiliary subunit
MPGIKLDSTFTIANVIQIFLLIVAAGGVWLNGYTDRLAQAEAMRDLQQMIETNTIRIQTMEESRRVLLEKNDGRVASIQDSINSHENRLNVADVRADATRDALSRETSALRDRIAEIFDELRDLNAYLKELGLARPMSLARPSTTDDRRVDK